MHVCITSIPQVFLRYHYYQGICRRQGWIQGWGNEYCVGMGKMYLTVLRRVDIIWIIRQPRYLELRVSFKHLEYIGAKLCIEHRTPCFASHVLDHLIIAASILKVYLKKRNFGNITLESDQFDTKALVGTPGNL